MKKKILIVTPKFPFPAYGACEQDRAAGIEQFIGWGYEVSVLTKVSSEKYKKEAETLSAALGVPICAVSYKYLRAGMSKTQKIKNFWGRLLRPWYIDGAAYEYTDPEIQQELIRILDDFKPDLVWFDYTYLWPLFRFVKKRGIPIVTRSINFEAVHFLEEDGRNFLNYLKFLPKLLSEFISGRSSDILFAITPDEEKLYRKIRSQHVVVLPLRGISSYLSFKANLKDSRPLHVFFFGSTYNVAHNRAAAEMLLREIIPLVQKTFLGEFHFHIFGAKLPAHLEALCVDGVTHHGYLPLEELNTVFEGMDIALIPSLYGAGMQQKIFEPLARGFPTLVSPRGIAGYPFYPEEHLLSADSVEDFVGALGKLRDLNLRKKLSEKAKEQASALFSYDRKAGNIRRSLDELLLNSPKI